MCPRHWDAYARSSLGRWTQPPPARSPCRLRAKERVRNRCAPPEAPQRPDHTHVQQSQGRGSHPGRAAEPVRWPLLPWSGWFSVTPGLRPSPPYPQKPTGRFPSPGATLTLFGAPAGRSVFSLPAGLDANVEKDGSSASLTAMSDSPGGCLWAKWCAHRRRSQGATFDHDSGKSHRPSPLPAPYAAPTSLMWGPRRSSGVRSSGGTRTPKSTKRKKDVERSQNQNLKLPEILLLWIKYKWEMPF